MITNIFILVFQHFIKAGKRLKLLKIKKFGVGQYMIAIKDVCSKVDMKLFEEKLRQSPKL